MVLGGTFVCHCGQLCPRYLEEIGKGESAAVSSSSDDEEDDSQGASSSEDEDELSGPPGVRGNDEASPAPATEFITLMGMIPCSPCACSFFVLCVLLLDSLLQGRVLACHTGQQVQNILRQLQSAWQPPLA